MVKYTRCSVYGCSVRNLQFFHFPRNVQRAEKWRELAGNPTLFTIPLDKLHHKASVCKRHFTRDQFTNTKLDRLNLNAFPSLHLPPPGNPDPQPPHEEEEVPPPPPLVNPPLPPPPVLHYVVFPSSVDPSVIAPPTTVQLPSKGKVCLGSREEPSPEMGVAEEETMPPVFRCDAGDPSVQGEVSPSFAVVAEYCETEGLKESEEQGEEVEEAPMDGHYKYTLCRLCFTTLDIVTTDIFSVDKGCGYVIKDVIEDLLQFKVSKIDEYPQYICASCLNKLTEFREFKEKILKDKAVFEEALRKLKSSEVEEEEGLAEDAAVDPSQHPDICPTDFVQLITFDANGEDINVGVTDNTPEVKGQGLLEVGGKRGGGGGCSALQQLEEDFTDLMAETARDLAHSEVLCEADRLTASVEEPVIGPELVIRRELNTGIVGLEEPSGRWQGGSRWLEYRDHLANNKLNRKKGPLRSRMPLHECHFCGKRFKKQEDLSKHIAMHSNLSAEECCARCGAVLKVAVLQNGRPRAVPMKPPLCATCRKAFGEEVHVPSRLGAPSSLKFRSGGEEGRREFNVDILVMKDARSHRGKKLFSCRQCGKSFPMTEILERHMKMSHLSKKRFRCEHCNKRFVLKRCLHDHVKLHVRGMS